MSDNTLPYENKWGFNEWLQWKIGSCKCFYATTMKRYLCRITQAYGDYGEGIGDTLDEAARACAISWCDKMGEPLPFQRMPDMSTIEKCINLIVSAGGRIALGVEDEIGFAVRAFRPGRTTGICSGERNGSVTLEVVQDATRYVLGIDE